MKAHLINTNLLVPRSRSSAEVKVIYHGHVSQKMGVPGVLVLHKHILFDLDFLSSFKHPTAVLAPTCSALVVLYSNVCQSYV